VNAWINTNEPPPENWTEAEKLLALLQFWMRWNPEFRKGIVRQHEQKGHMFSCSDGIIQAILHGLEYIDRDKLIEELQGAGLVSKT